MDQRSLASLLDKSQGTIWSIENGYIKNISSADAVKILNATRKIKNIPNETILLNRVSEIAKRGRFHDEYAKKMSKRASKDKSIRSAVLSMPTKQENVLIKALNKQKINFQFHGVIKASRKFVVDFVFPSERDPKLVLEIKDLQSNYRKRLLAIDLAYRAIKIRQNYPNIKLIALVDGNLQNDALQIIKPEYDKVIQNASSEEVLDIIKGFMQ